MPHCKWTPRPLSKPWFVELIQEGRWRGPDGRWQIPILFAYDSEAAAGGRPKNTDDPRYEQLRQALLFEGWRTIETLIGYDRREVRPDVKRRDAQIRVEAVVGEKELGAILEHGRRFWRGWTSADSGRGLNRWDRTKLPILQRRYGAGSDIESLIDHDLDVLRALLLGRDRAKEFARDYRAATADYRRTRRPESGILLVGGGPRAGVLGRLWIAMYGWVNAAYLWFDRVELATLLDAGIAVGQLAVGKAATVTTVTARELLACAAFEHPADALWSDEEIATAAVRSQAQHLINLPNLEANIGTAERLGACLMIERKIT